MPASDRLAETCAWAHESETRPVTVAEQMIMPPTNTRPRPQSIRPCAEQKLSCRSRLTWPARALVRSRAWFTLRSILHVFLLLLSTRARRMNAELDRSCHVNAPGRADLDPSRLTAPYKYAHVARVVVCSIANGQKPPAQVHKPLPIEPIDGRPAPVPTVGRRR